jgi:hypothetical protein
LIGEGVEEDVLSIEAQGICAIHHLTEVIEGCEHSA